jgi:hypothetical protein
MTKRDQMTNAENLLAVVAACIHLFQIVLCPARRGESLARSAPPGGTLRQRVQLSSGPPVNRPVDHRLALLRAKEVGHSVQQLWSIYLLLYLPGFYVGGDQATDQLPAELRLGELLGNSHTELQLLQPVDHPAVGSAHVQQVKDERRVSKQYTGLEADAARLCVPAVFSSALSAIIKVVQRWSSGPVVIGSPPADSVLYPL